MAVPMAVSALRGVVTGEVTVASGSGREALLSGFYLGWLLQANYLQYGFLYHLTPPVFLALTVVAGRRWLPGRSPLGWVLLAIFLAVAVRYHPLADLDRTALWSRCFLQDTPAELWARLALDTEPRAPDWLALERVAAFLKERRVRDGELTCYSFGTDALYLRLGLEPSTRYINVEEVLHYFPSLRDDFQAELEASRERYIVSDLRSLASELRAEGLAEVRVTGGLVPRLEFAPEARGKLERCFPWSEPVIFRDGPYLVHRRR
jgi:hypothetical protein